MAAIMAYRCEMDLSPGRSIAARMAETGEMRICMGTLRILRAVRLACLFHFTRSPAWISQSHRGTVVRHGAPPAATGVRDNGAGPGGRRQLKKASGVASRLAGR